MPTHLYLSPHLDDAVYSCGGLIAAQFEAGDDVMVLTICAGDPPEGPLSSFALQFHSRWDSGLHPTESRREEDLQACGMLGAGVMHLSVPDAIYRWGAWDKVLYPTEQSIFGRLHADDQRFAEELADQLQSALPDDLLLYCPLGIGGHVDHLLTRIAAESIKMPTIYYHDLPYAARELARGTVQQAVPGEIEIAQVSDDNLGRWIEAIETYRSQFSTFWTSQADLVEEISRYLDHWGGIPLVIPQAPMEDEPETLS